MRAAVRATNRSISEFTQSLRDIAAPKIKNKKILTVSLGGDELWLHEVLTQKNESYCEPAQVRLNEDDEVSPAATEANEFKYNGAAVYYFFLLKKKEVSLSRYTE